MVTVTLFLLLSAFVLGTNAFLFPRGGGGGCGCAQSACPPPALAPVCTPQSPPCSPPSPCGRFPSGGYAQQQPIGLVGPVGPVGGSYAQPPFDGYALGPIGDNPSRPIGGPWYVQSDRPIGSNLVGGPIGNGYAQSGGPIDSGLVDGMIESGASYAQSRPGVGDYAQGGRESVPISQGFAPMSNNLPSEIGAVIDVHGAESSNAPVSYTQGESHSQGPSAVPKPQTYGQETPQHQVQQQQQQHQQPLQSYAPEAQHQQHQQSAPQPQHQAQPERQQQSYVPPNPPQAPAQSQEYEAHYAPAPASLTRQEVPAHAIQHEDDEIAPVYSTASESSHANQQQHQQSQQEHSGYKAKVHAAPNADDASAINLTTTSSDDAETVTSITTTATQIESESMTTTVASTTTTVAVASTVKVSDPRCNSELLRTIIIEGIQEKPSKSKRDIQKRATADIGGKIDVICSTGVFSYIVNTDLYCEAEKNGVTCLAFRQSA